MTYLIVVVNNPPEVKSFTGKSLVHEPDAGTQTLFLEGVMTVG